MIEKVKVAATELVCCHGQSIHVCLLGIHKSFYGRNFIFFCTGVENGTVNWVLKFMFSVGIIRYILIIIFCYQEFYCQISVF